MKAKLLCVDDEPNVLEGLQRILRKQCEVVTAGSGALALEMLRSDPSIGIIMSDMRMPVMDGAQFLREARALRPDSLRLLLTGHSDLEAAVAAVNHGQVFRFLTKPCAPPDLMSAIDAALAQFNLVHAEKILLEQTLHGSIKTLTDVLALTSPLAFGRAQRVKQTVSKILTSLAITDKWQVELAAMVSQLGYVSLPQETLERFFYNSQTLSTPEKEMVGRVHTVTDQLIAHIPRLEGVRYILDGAWRGVKVDRTVDLVRQTLQRNAQILRIAVDTDVLELEGASTAGAIDTIRNRVAQYEPEVMQAFVACYSGQGKGEDLREIPLAGLRVGMRIDRDVRMATGALVIARGYEVTTSFIERARNYPPGTIKEPLRVLVGAISSA